MAQIKAKDFIVHTADKIKLNDINPDRPKAFSKDELNELLRKNTESIDELQVRLYAENKQSLLIVLQALDAGGKDGTIRKVFGPLNPQGVTVTSFKAPSALELSHDFLWRIHHEVPKKGEMKIFNRSHYEDVLIVRVHDWINESECKKRYEHIVNFEKLLADSGTRIIKIFLYISKDEQKERFQERIDLKEKNWKFAKQDLEERKYWDAYIRQFEEVFKETSTRSAPWYIIPANSNSYRNAVVSQIVLETLKEMDPKYPEPEPDLDKVVIE